VAHWSATHTNIYRDICGEQGKKNPAKPIPPSRDDLCTICYTSGTTGTPKVRAEAFAPATTHAKFSLIFILLSAVTKATLQSHLWCHIFLFFPSLRLAVQGAMLSHGNFIANVAGVFVLKPGTAPSPAAFVLESRMRF
jgi:acyl-coenzyme A synthetase/AMP-(fatty) acid ligase